MSTDETQIVLGSRAAVAGESGCRLPQWRDLPPQFMTQSVDRAMADARASQHGRAKKCLLRRQTRSQRDSVHQSQLIRHLLFKNLAPPPRFCHPVRLMTRTERLLAEIIALPSVNTAFL